MNNNIILVYGGNSVEHEISIITALQIKNQYKGKYNLILCYLKDGKFYSSKNLTSIKNYSNGKYKKGSICFVANQKFIKQGTKKIYFDGVWIVTHGKNCEDGTLTSYFKVLNIPVIAQDTLSAAIGQNKYISKLLSKANSLPYFLVNKFNFNNSLTSLLSKAENIGYPLIIKPSNLGSSVGISIANNNGELIDTIDNLFNLDDQLIIEKYLESFYELNIALIKYKNEIIVSEVEKINNKSFLTYDDKYKNDSKSMCSLNKELPAKISQKLLNELIGTSKNIYNNLNCSLIVRMDYLYDINNEILYFNEINNIPGSLAFYLFNKKAISTSELVDMCIDEGLKNCNEKEKLITSYDKNILKEDIFDNVKFSK